MIRWRWILAIVVCWSILSVDTFSAEPAQGMKEVVPLKAVPFDLRDVRLLDGPFRHAMELDRRYLLSLPPERLLHAFRVNAGLPSSAKPLGGWEALHCEVRGHFVGHYLSACAMMVRSTADQKLKANADQVVAGMAECQAKIGTGYLSAFPDEFIDRVAAAKPVWAPWYTIHKIYAGLLDMYVLCDNRQALEVVTKACDWVKARTDRLSDEQMERMLGNEHGGMNEVLANLAAVTSQQKYLRLAQRFNHRAVLDPLAQREDRLSGLHANTQFPKLIGVARQYELTGDQRLRTMATFFWDVVTRERSYVIGGNSDGEVFSPKERLSRHIGAASTETCNTYNMLRLTRRLFGQEPKAEYADYYERALYNHILASQHPETGMMCYYVPLKAGCAKGRLNPTGFNTPFDSFWCCTGTGVENHAKYNDSIYFHDGGAGLYVNLFIASELNWRDKGVTLRQETKYPEESATRLVLTCRRPTELTLHVRRPYWALSDFQIKVNGKPESFQTSPGSFATLTRQWQSGDAVDISMPMSLRTEGFRDNPRKIALMYGPLVLCARTEPGNTLAAILVEPSQVLQNVKPAPGKRLTFTGPSDLFRTSFTKKADVTFIPFYQEFTNPYVVYWDVMTEAQWKAKEAEHQAELACQEELAARTVDEIQFRPELEQAHNLKGEKTGAGDYEDRPWRHATDGGWFSFEMKVVPDRPQELLCTYWGSDAGSRVFDILVEGTKLATERLQHNRPGKFYDQAYAIPEALTKDKTKVTVKFQAHPGQWAGGVFGCRVIKK